MSLLTSLTVRNFKCFRNEVTIPLQQATYLVGANNSGKTSFLTALRCFFETAAFSPEYLNKTERAGRREGSNRADISVRFDLTNIPGKARKRRMVAEHGDQLLVRKSLTWREVSATVYVEYTIGRKTGTYEDLPTDVRELIDSVSISYIHPQEGAELLRRAQAKFKERLFQNWGRHVSVADTLKAVQDKWDTLRKTANTYLSATLTERLRAIWPESETKVDLPERIEDIVAISDISFRSSPTLPEVTLPSHGTGAQSAILYQTHYILDSDRTLHRGMYYPVWLLEEPESFLHADIALQMAQLLSSEEWLSDIQMLISTHSPIILAGSRQSPSLTSWAVCEDHAVVMSKPVVDVVDEDVRQIGSMMGDANFDVYFAASQRGPLVFLEDSRALTTKRFVEAGIPVTEALDGVSQVKKYLSVFPTLNRFLRESAYFIVDSDKGKSEIAHLLAGKAADKSILGWKRHKIANKVYLVTLPEGFAAEDLFAEWDDELSTCLDDLFESGTHLRSSIPTSLSRAASELRKRAPASRELAKDMLRTQQDVKDRFWLRVEAESLHLEPKHKGALLALLE